MPSIVSLIAGDPTTFDAPVAPAYIVPLTRDGGTRYDPKLAKLAFQWVPDSLTLVSESGFSDQKSIGGSHENERWGGKPSRTFEFTAKFSNDEPLAASVAFSTENIGTEFLQEDASAFGLKSVPFDTGSVERNHASPDIRAAMQWLQSFTFPTYRDGIALPPRMMNLVLVGCAIGRNGTDAFRCTMRRITFSIKALWPGLGIPRFVEAQISFTESIRHGRAQHNHDAANYEVSMDSAGPAYTIRPAGVSAR